MGGIHFFQLRTDATLVIDGRRLKTAPKQKDIFETNSKCRPESG